MRKLVSLVVITLLVISLVVGCGQQSSQQSVENNIEGEPSVENDKQIVLRYADTAVPGDPDYEGNVYFADLVKERSGGKVIVEYYHSGQLGSDKAITQSTIAGTIDIAKCSGGNFTEFSNALYFTDLPGLFKDMNHVRAVWQSDIRDEIVDKIKQETGLTVLMFDIDGGAPREIGNTKKPIYVPDDMKGIKMRTTGSPVEVALFRAWGASAVPVAWSETYTSLQQGVIDAHYNQPQHTFMVGRLGEVIDYYSMIGQSWVTSVKVLGKTAEEKLGPEYYDLVIECAKEAELYKDTLTEKINEESIKGLEDLGVEIIRPTEEQIELWTEKSLSIWDEFVGKEIPEELVKKVQNLNY